MKRFLFQFKVIVSGPGGFREIHQVSHREDGLFRYSHLDMEHSVTRTVRVSELRCIACVLLEHFPEGYPDGTELDVDIEVSQKDGSGNIVRRFRAASAGDGLRVSVLEVPSGASESATVPFMSAKCFLCVLFEETADAAISIRELVAPCPGLCRPDCPGLSWFPRHDGSTASP